MIFAIILLFLILGAKMLLYRAAALYLAFFNSLLLIFRRKSFLNRAIDIWGKVIHK